MVNADRIRALRHAREVVGDLRWRGMTVPPIYASMAEEFQALVRSGAYAAWVASAQKAGREARPLRRLRPLLPRPGVATVHTAGDMGDRSARSGPMYRPGNGGGDRG
jgi:hypothetical protein